MLICPGLTVSRYAAADGGSGVFFPTLIGFKPSPETPRIPGPALVSEIPSVRSLCCMRRFLWRLWFSLAALFQQRGVGERPSQHDSDLFVLPPRDSLVRAFDMMTIIMHDMMTVIQVDFYGKICAG